MFGADHLDRHRTPQARVACAKHLAHTAFAEQRFQLVRTQSSAGYEARDAHLRCIGRIRGEHVLDFASSVLGHGKPSL
jgi:hypothetical protein